MDVTYRKANEEDSSAIAMLLKEIFGNVYRNDGILFRVANEIVYVAEYNGNIIGTTGISLDRTDFNGHEISWTGVKSEFRGQDIMINLVQNCLNELTNTTPIYLSAWHIGRKDKPNLHKTIDYFGFKLVCESYRHYDKNHYRFCKTCTFREACNGCTEDLYILER